jgi:hypothetical protein
VLKWHRFGEEAICILQSLLGCGRDQSEAAKRGCNQEKTAEKVHHVEESLQLFDILRGGTRVDCTGVLGCGGRTCSRNGVPKNFLS